MNFRSTFFLFGLLLGMLWIFGLTVAYKKTAVDASYLLPSLQAHPDVVIDSIVIQRRQKGKEPEEFRFIKKGEDWTLQLPGVKKSVKLESFRINQMVNQVKDARRSDEAGVSDDLTKYGLDQPATTVTLKGHAPEKPEQEWNLYIGGRESGDNVLVFLNSSDRPAKVYAILKSNIDNVLFKDPNSLRSRRIFEFTDTAVLSIDIKDGAAELALKKEGDKDWRFEKPDLGFAEYESPPPPKELAPAAKSVEGGVKGLLANIGTIRVDAEDDFVPISDEKLSTFGLEAGKETMRIEVDTKGGKEKTDKEILAIGSRVKGKDQVYARLVSDEGVFKLNTKLLEPLQKIVANPGSLRTLNILSIDLKKVDAMVLEQGSAKATLLRPDDKAWEIELGSTKPQKANQQAATALLDAVEGKHAIIRYYDGEDYKKLDAQMKSPIAVLSIYVEGLKPAKTDAAKDGKEPAKKDQDAKKEQSPHIQKDAKAAAILKFGSSDKETINVERVLASGATSRFAVARTILERVLPGELNLAFLDTALPAIGLQEVDRVVISRPKNPIDIVKGWGEKSGRWFFKEGNEPPGKNPTDAPKASTLVNGLSTLSAQKWLHPLDPKEDLDKYGLKKPASEVTLYVHKESDRAAAILVSQLAIPSEWRGLLGATAVLANQVAGPQEKIVLKIGKETDNDKEKPGVYALRSDKNMIFLISGDTAKELTDINLQDRTAVLAYEPTVGATLLGLFAANPASVFLGGSPLCTNLVQSFDAAKVKELKFAVRTPEELRSFAFQRAAGMEWRDQSGLQEFNLDSAKVTKTIEQLASLKASGWVNLAGGTKIDQKLTAKEATLRIEAVLEGGQSITLLVGAPFERLGYYGRTSLLPDAVFLLSPAQVEPFLQGPGYFGKERVAGR